MIVCDVCNNNVSLRLHQTVKCINGKEVIRTFLKCDKCGKTYTCYYDDDSTIVMKKKLNKLMARFRYDGANCEAMRTRTLKDIDNKRQKLERKTCSLQAKYSKYFSDDDE